MTRITYLNALTGKTHTFWARVSMPKTTREVEITRLAIATHTNTAPEYIIVY